MELWEFVICCCRNERVEYCSGSKDAVYTAQCRHSPAGASLLVLFLNGLVFVVELVIRARLVFACEVIKIFVLIKVNYAHIVANILIKIKMLTAFAKIRHSVPF